MRSVDVAKDGEPTSPDSVLDLRAGYKRKRTDQEAQDLQLLRRKIQAECSQVCCTFPALWNAREAPQCICTHLCLSFP